MEEWRYRSTILNLGTRWSFTALPLYPRENSLRQPLYIGGWVGPRQGLDVMKKKKSLAPAGESNSDSSVAQRVD
jgi:hypothetical protein